MNVLESVLKYMDIDTRLALGARPRRLDPKLISNLESKLTRDTLVYLPHTKTIFNFVSKSEGHMRILRPMTLDFEVDGLYMFNLENQDWTYEIIGDRGDVFVTTMSHPWCSDLKLKIVKETDEAEDTTSPT